MYSLNIDPNNPRGNPDPAELRNLGVEKVRYTYYDSTRSDQLDRSKADFFSQKAMSYHEAGIGSLVILTYDTFPGKPTSDAPDSDWDAYINRLANRAGQIAQLLKPFGPAYQVWNEPDHPVRPDYSPTLREAVFGRMLRRIRDAIKAVDPQALIVTAGLASGNPGWLTTVINSQGGSLPADIVAFHPYGQRPDPNWPNPNWAFGYVGNLLNNYYKAGQNKPLWITEMGVKEEDLGNNHDQVAEFLRRYYRTMTNRFSDKVQELFWFCYGDGMVPTFGLRDSAGSPKPAYSAFRQAVAERPAPSAEVAAPPPPPSPVVPPVEIVTSPVSPVSALPATPVIGDTEVAQLTQRMTTLESQMKALQNQLAQMQSLVQQLVNQQSQPSQPPVAVPPPPIQNIINQLKRDPNQQFPIRPLNQIDLLIIHHTAINPTVGADRIAEHRVDKQGWPGIGYHYFITGDGLIQQTNELTTEATHAGSFNPSALGICFAGDFTQVAPPPAQIEAGAQLIAWLLGQFNLSLDAVRGYKELVNTQSPGLQWDDGLRWGDTLRAKIQAYL